MLSLNDNLYNQSLYKNRISDKNLDDGTIIINNERNRLQFLYIILFARLVPQWNQPEFSRFQPWLEETFLHSDHHF